MEPSCCFRRTSAKAGLWLICAILLAWIPAVLAAGQSRERIVYTTFRQANTEINLFDTPDRAPSRLTTDPALDYNPVYSSDGKWLVLTSSRGGLNDEEPLLTVFNPQPYGEVYAVRLTDGVVVRQTHNKWRMAP